MRSALISAPLDAGTSGSVVVTAGSTKYYPRVASYKVMGLLSSTAVDTDVSVGSAARTFSQAVDVTQGGIVLAVANTYHAAAGAGSIITGATEDYDYSVTAEVRTVGGSHLVTADESGRAVVFDIDYPPSTSMSAAICVASFR